MSHRRGSAEEPFRTEIRARFESALTGRLQNMRGPHVNREDEDLSRALEEKLGEAGLGCIGWPKTYGGRAATLAERVIFAEEWARAGLASRPNHVGVELIGPTLLEFGTEAQKTRFLPPIVAGREFWAQCFSEPNAGSDLANVQTRAHLEDGADGPHWVIEGQKTWGSHAQMADWCFVVCRTDAGSAKSKGLSFLLVPLRQPGITMHPVRQMTGESDFNDIFFDGARTPAENIVGAPGDGWRIAMATLSYERGVSTFGYQVRFRRELNEITAAARANGKASDPIIRQRLAQAEIGLRVMHAFSMRMLTNMESGRDGPEAILNKLFFPNWHQALGELAMDILGRKAELAPGDEYRFPELTRMFLFSRADSIGSGTSQVQRNLIGERVLGLPREPR